MASGSAGYAVWCQSSEREGCSPAVSVGRFHLPVGTASALGRRRWAETSSADSSVSETMPFRSDPVTLRSGHGIDLAELLTRVSRGRVSGFGLFMKEKSMSFVTTQPEALSAAAGDLQGIGAVSHRPERGGSRPDDGGDSRGSRRGVGADGSTVHRARPAVPSGQRSSRGDSRNVRATLGTSAASYAATEAANAVAAG